MLVVVGLFALISVAGVILVESVLTAQRRTEGRLARLGQVQRALFLLTRDIEQAEPTTLAFDNGALVFVRHNLQDRQISVSYGVIGRVLVRTLDSVKRQPVLAGVKTAAWRFHAPSAGWRIVPQIKGQAPPDGVELDLETENEGLLRKVVELTSPP